MKSHATHAARARNKRGSSVDFARILRGFCVGFARNLILFLFEREREGYKRFADCTVSRPFHKHLNNFVLLLFNVTENKYGYARTVTSDYVTFLTDI